MNWAVAFFIAAGNTLLSLTGYLAWPSRWNVPTHLGVSMCVTAFWIPLFGSMGYDSPSEQITNLYVLLTCIAIPAMVLGVVLGKVAFRRSRFHQGDVSWFPEVDWILLGKICRKTALLMVLGLAGMGLSFYMMGYVPLFAADPFAAKFFKGEYQQSYSKVAVIHRTATQLVAFGIPIGVYLGLTYRRIGTLVISILSVLGLTLTMSRSLTFYGFLVALGLLSARRRSTFFAYFVFMLLMMPLGSLSYYLLGQVFPRSGFDFGTADSLADRVMQGAPDINDQLMLLDAFQASQQWTYGRTFVGGLIPYNYHWNPAVWTLTTVSGSPDISNTVSGGFRLPVSLWGYTAFGYTGTFLIPFLSGLISGWWGGLMQDRVRNGERPVQTILWISLYSSLGHQMCDFYLASIHNAPAIACALFLRMGSKLKYAGAASSTTVLVPKAAPSKPVQPVAAAR